MKYEYKEFIKNLLKAKSNRTEMFNELDRVYAQAAKADDYESGEE